MENIIDKIPAIIRWIVALPVSIMCGWLARWLALTSYYLWNGIDLNDWWPFILGTASETFAFLYVFYLIVPLNKFLASVIVSSVWGGVTLCLLIILLTNPYPLSGKIFDILTDLTTIVVLITSCVAIYRSEKEQSATAE